MACRALSQGVQAPAYGADGPLWLPLRVAGQARLLLEDPSCVEEILDAWDALLPAALARFGARLVLLQAFLEGYRTGLFVKAPVRARAPVSPCMHARVHARMGAKEAYIRRVPLLGRFSWRASSRDPISEPAACEACQNEPIYFC